MVRFASRSLAFIRGSPALCWITGPPRTSKALFAVRTDAPEPCTAHADAASSKTLPMKILRHLTPSGPAYAALQADGSAREIAGDIYGSHRVTDKVVKPGKTLAPIVPTNILCIGLNYKKHAA